MRPGARRGSLCPSLVVKRLTMLGFIVSDFSDQRDKALSDLQAWVAAGKIKIAEDVVSGLENAPAALVGFSPARTAASAW
jgi:NADPH-dependent curcumin reductase CurA